MNAITVWRKEEEKTREIDSINWMVNEFITHIHQNETSLDHKITDFSNHRAFCASCPTAEKKNDWLTPSYENPDLKKEKNSSHRRTYLNPNSCYILNIKGKNCYTQRNNKVLQWKRWTRKRNEKIHRHTHCVCRSFCSSMKKWRCVCVQLHRGKIMWYNEEEKKESGINTFAHARVSQTLSLQYKLNVMQCIALHCIGIPCNGLQNVCSNIGAPFFLSLSLYFYFFAFFSMVFRLFPMCFFFIVSML